MEDEITREQDQEKANILYFDTKIEECIVNGYDTICLCL